MIGPLLGRQPLILYREVELLPKFERMAIMKRPCSPLQIQITFLACIVTRIAMLLKEHLDVCRRLLGSVAGRTRCSENDAARIMRGVHHFFMFSLSLQVLRITRVCSLL